MIKRLQLVIACLLLWAAVNIGPSVFLALGVAEAQNYTQYNGSPVARVSFLRSQYAATTNVLSDPTLLLWLPLSGTTQTFLDISGNNHNGTYTGPYSPAFFSGKIGPIAPYFNHSHSPNNFINVAAFSLPATFTVNAWCKPNSLASNYVRIVESYYYSGFYLGTNSTGTSFAWMVNDPSVSGLATGGTTTVGTWPNTAWQMVTGTYNGSTGTLYVNGSAVSTQTFTSPGTTNLPIGIGYCSTADSAGCSPNSPYNSWDGEIQGVRIYSRALGASEIQAIYNAENH